LKFKDKKGAKDKEKTNLVSIRTLDNVKDGNLNTLDVLAVAGEADQLGGLVSGEANVNTTELLRELTNAGALGPNDGAVVLGVNLNLLGHGVGNGLNQLLHELLGLGDSLGSAPDDDLVGALVVALKVDLGASGIHDLEDAVLRGGAQTHNLLQDGVVGGQGLHEANRLLVLEQLKELLLRLLHALFHSGEDNDVTGRVVAGEPNIDRVTVNQGLDELALRSNQVSVEPLLDVELDGDKTSAFGLKKRKEKKEIRQVMGKCLHKTEKRTNSLVLAMRASLASSTFFLTPVMTTFCVSESSFLNLLFSAGFFSSSFLGASATFLGASAAFLGASAAFLGSSFLEASPPFLAVSAPFLAVSPPFLATSSFLGATSFFGASAFLGAS